jgi:hypothetical protein
MYEITYFDNVIKHVKVNKSWKGWVGWGWGEDIVKYE